MDKEEQICPFKRLFPKLEQVSKIFLGVAIMEV